MRYCVLMFISEGLTNRDIAAKLRLQDGTVRNYVSSILAKLGLNNRAEAAAYAITNGIKSTNVSSGNGEKLQKGAFSPARLFQDHFVGYLLFTFFTCYFRRMNRINAVPHNLLLT